MSPGLSVTYPGNHRLDNVGFNALLSLGKARDPGLNKSPSECFGQNASLLQLPVSGDVKEMKKDLVPSSLKQEYSHVLLFSWGGECGWVGRRMGRRGETPGGGTFEQG